MSVRSMRLVLCMVFCLLVGIKGVSAQDTDYSQEVWEQTLQENGFVLVDTLPSDVEPMVIDNLNQINELSQTMEIQADIREEMPVAMEADPLSLTLMPLSTTYWETREVKDCRTPVGASEFIGYADVTIGNWIGVYRAYQVLHRNWWTHAGYTLGISISNVSQSYYFATPTPSTALWMRNDFTINWYIVTPWGNQYVRSEPSYVHCQKPA